MKTLNSGYFNDDLDFKYGEGTTVHSGCGAMLVGDFWYFGGDYPNMRQVNSGMTLKYI